MKKSAVVSRSGRFASGPAAEVAAFSESISFDWRLWKHDILGSLAHAAMLHKIGVLTKAELLLPLVGGLYVVEAASVIIQVVSFKLTGRRVFRMAPLHHHFELAGWPEPKIVVRFWIISFALALLALTTLKLR